MRRLIVPIALSLALITGAWVGQAYALFAPLEPIGTAGGPSQRVPATVWRFYDAIDLLLRTGDADPLRAVVDPEFVDHADEPRAPSDREALVGYLASLRATYPGLRLVPEDVVAQGDRAVARLAPIVGVEGAILGIPLAGVPPWPRVDVVRVRGDRIIERWGNQTGYGTSAVLFAETLAFARDGDPTPFLLRVAFAPGADDRPFVQRGPAILSVESGVLDVSTDGAGASSRARALAPGGTLVIPDGMAFAARNLTGAPAVALLLTLVQPLANVPGARAGEPGFLGNGISVRAVAGDAGAVPNPGKVRAELARITLAPGARLAAHAVAGAELVAVEGGTLTATFEGDGRTARLWDRDGRSVPLGPYARVAAGSGLSVSWGAAATSYGNETDRPVTLLLLTLASG